MINKVELLAPAGNKEAYMGAVNAGADAIYLGGEKFSARAYADNFNQEEIIECIRYGHLNNCRTYLTVNTLVKEDELEEFVGFLIPFYQCGLDGVIVQDLGAATVIHRLFPDMELHISTQMTITGSYGVEYVRDMGAVRVVPARECSLKDIESMKKDSGMEMECFVHGAMCYCYSGQCLMSSVLGGRSGNRGRCAGPCRLPYRPEFEKEQSYPLSLKDLCTIEMIPQLIKGGIDSFKIEGRMKKPEYAAGVTAIYRKYIDQFYDNPKAKYEVKKADLDFLKDLYIRSDIQTGYYEKRNAREMVTLSEGCYQGSEPDVLTDIRNKYIDKVKKKRITVKVEIISGQKAYIEMRWEKYRAFSYGSFVEEAKGRALSVADIEKQIKKLGNTYFEAADIEVITDLQSFYSVKELNELRRKVVLLLENQIIKGSSFSCERNIENIDYNSTCKVNNSKKHESKGFSLLFYSLEQSLGLLDLTVEELKNVERVYFEMGIFDQHEENDILQRILEKLRSCNIEIILSLPVIAREGEWKFLAECLTLTQKHIIDGVLVKNLEELSFMKQHGYQGRVYTDTNIYCFNSEAVLKVLEDANGFTYPMELSRKEERNLFENWGLNSYGEKIIYGRTILMVSANCIFKTFQKCYGKGSHFTYLEDRKNTRFPVLADCRHCQNLLFNSLPLSLHKDLDKKYDGVMKRLIFTTENTKETLEIIRYFIGGLKDNTSDLPFSKFTTGHTSEGVL